VAPSGSGDRRQPARRERAPSTQPQPRMAEVASLLTDQPLATPRTQSRGGKSRQPPFRSLDWQATGSTRRRSRFATAQRASSKNPIELSDEEVGEIVTRSL
jgi:hypothetical protein